MSTKLLKCNINQYVIEKNDECKKYICKDQFQNTYIFEEKNIGEYTIILDNYTLPQENWIEQYQEESNKGKVAMHISRWVDMINVKDYHAAYQLLAENFQTNYFQTEECFEEYIRKQFYSYHDIQFIKFSDELSGVYTYYIEICNRENEESTKIKMNIIMELLENENARFSFEILNEK